MFSKTINRDKDHRIVFALNILFNTLYVFNSKLDVAEKIEGIEIAEGDWRFFAADGSPMAARFSTPARINPERNTYTNGVYSLEAASGSKLQDILPTVSAVDSADLENVTEVEKFLAKQSGRAGR
jgi:hypothetical protein